MNGNDQRNDQRNEDSQNGPRGERHEGGRQHDWNRNTDESSRDTQRDDKQRQSFAYTDHFDDGPHYHGPSDLPSSPDRKDRRNDFKPLNGSFTNTVDRGPVPAESSGFREVDRQASRDLNRRNGQDIPHTSSLYGSRANDMSRGMNPYGYGLGDSNYNDTYYGRDASDYQREMYRRQANQEGPWESMKDSVKSFFGKGPKGYKRSDERIHEDVCEVLARHPGIDASEIEVKVEDGHVFLRGEVDSRFTKRRAEDVIDHISGVHDVRNELTVRRPDVEGGRSVRGGSGIGASASLASSQSGAGLMNESRGGNETAFGSTGTAGTTGSAVNSGTHEGDGDAKIGSRDLH
ncbi:MAG: BON domain-containing protein [Proteobacteria bacterium]|nr:MAG: BON domain-containing protein [Pseudomonadota bacterium]